jgi:hypothetical protein
VVLDAAIPRIAWDEQRESLRGQPTRTLMLEKLQFGPGRPGFQQRPGHLAAELEFDQAARGSALVWLWITM